MIELYFYQYALVILYPFYSYFAPPGLSTNNRLLRAQSICVFLYNRLTVVFSRISTVHRRVCFEMPVPEIHEILVLINVPRGLYSVDRRS